MEQQVTLKCGQQIKVRQHAIGGDVLEDAKVARRLASMQPLPTGYVPVRFASDGARLLVHVSSIVAE